MDPLTVKLASLRLAPVQVGTWGHPETSGFRRIGLEELITDNENDYVSLAVRLHRIETSASISEITWDQDVISSSVM